MDKKSITVILGTARDGNWSQKVASYVCETLKERSDIDVTFVNVKEYIYGRTIAPWENNPIISNWGKLVDKTDIFIIVFPEYNHGYPGELKILLDQEYTLYKRKKVGLCGVSKGIFGGVRGIENIKPVLIELGLVVNQYSVYFSGVQELFKKPKEEIDTHYKDRVNKLVDLLLKD
ncbi:MAG: NAD(P)H-dependent oxidoreductase [Candidatus Gracilibacteria bacterium]|nr:NAD(P)H-dependent oxidoreductase [Candidatus Gracilibacteria bacterium]